MTIFPKFVWCCELTTRAFYQKDQVLGEIIIDATSAADAKTNSFIIIHYPNAVCYRRPEDFVETGDAEFKYDKNWCTFTVFQDNLKNCSRNRRGK